MTKSRRQFLREILAYAATASAAPLRSFAESASIRTEFSGYDGMALAEMIRKKKVTPLELVENTLKRIDAVNPKLNLVLTKLFDVEKARARAKQPFNDSPLAGVPILLKNIVEYKDADIDFGSRLYKRYIAEHGRLHQASSPFIQAVESAGMIITGITNAPEFGLIDTTEPLAHGASRNPWNPEYTTGGSSGGSAAAVAAGLVPLAHANDGGGSIRIPSSQCGVFGLKPTRKRELRPFSIGGLANDVAGINSDLCVSRSVRDTAAFLSIVENKANEKLPPVGFVSGPSTKRLKIALILEGINGKRPDPEVERATHATAKLCESLKHNVEEIHHSIDGAELTDAFLGYWSAGAVGIEADLEKMFGKEARRDEFLEPSTLGLIEIGKKRGLFQAVGRANKSFGAAATELEKLFGKYDVILSPVLRIPPYKIGFHAPTVDFQILLDRLLDAVVYTPLHNICGTPAMSVPLYWTKDGLPIGSQFAAWRGGEALLLGLAYELEAARPWAKRRPQIFAA